MIYVLIVVAVIGIMLPISVSNKRKDMQKKIEKKAELLDVDVEFKK